MGDNNGWDQYKLLVMESLERIERSQEDQTEEISKLKDDVATIKTEARVAKWVGNLVVPAGITIAVSWVGRKLGF